MLLGGMMIELSVVRDLVAIFGVIAGFSYYVLTVRNNQRNQKQQLETRQAQLFMQIYYTWSSREMINIRKELRTWTWTDYDDFIQKYGEANNPDAHALLQELASWYEGIGVLIKRKLIDPVFVDDLMSGATLWGWETFGSYVRERRVRDNMPFYYEFWEYLYDEVSTIAHKQHPELKT